MNFTLTGDTTYAGIVFSPGVEGVEQVEVTLPWDEASDRETDGERSFTLEQHAAAEKYVRILAAGPKVIASVEAMITRLETEAEEHHKRADPDKGDECFWYVTAERDLEVARELRGILDTAREEVEG